MGFVHTLYVIFDKMSNFRQKNPQNTAATKPLCSAVVKLSLTLLIGLSCIRFET